MKNIILIIFLSIFISATASNAKAENVVLINPFTVPALKLEESIVFWEKARDFLKQEPGYVSTKLHQSLKPDATYQLVNVAEWESAEAFKSASQKMRDYFRSEKINMVEGLKNDPALYRVIRK
ncbi:MAG: antibiotic biosynthesis monooxygenase family protein [Desulforhopalus sp.]